MASRLLSTGITLAIFAAFVALSGDEAVGTTMSESPAASPAGTPSLLATVQAQQSATAAAKTATAEARSVQTATAQAAIDLTATVTALTATAAAQAAVEQAVAIATQNADLQAALVVMATSQAELGQSEATAEAAAERARATADAELAAVDATYQAELANAQATIEAQATSIGGWEATGTAIAIPTATPTPTATNTPTPTATPTPEPTATPTPLPHAGDVLYRTGRSQFKKWTLSPGWQYLDGSLLTDGRGPYSDFEPIFAPYDLSGIPNYAVEAEIRRTNDDVSSFGIVVRARGDAGYAVGVGYFGSGWNARVQLLSGWWGTNDRNGDVAEGPRFNPGIDWHVYRVEVEGNQITLLIDGAVALSTTDNRYLSGAAAGLWANQVELEVRSFKIIALGNSGSAEDDGATDEDAGASSPDIVPRTADSASVVRSLGVVAFLSGIVVWSGRRRRH